jgi:hypothetical protein
MNKETVLITGASAGIGYELAKIFAEKGYHLILVARRKEKLAELAAGLHAKHRTQTAVFQKDLSQAGAPLELYHEILGQKLSVDILVNNAGIGVYGPFAETSREQEAAMIQLNIAALTQLTKLFLSGMRERGHGRIMNVASTAAFQPGPYMAVYYATKAYVLSLSEALAYELRGTGIRVCAFCPGPTTTEFQEAAQIGDHVKLFKVGVMTAQEVARIGYEGMMKNRTVIVAGFTNAVGAFLGRFAPRACVMAVLEKIQSTKNAKVPAAH